ncbi:MAG: Sigma 54 modulation protein / ribosomal protein [Solirubrobacteraceae bacterium]|jgi:ribosome-associated translation inhibitor RaiA|nr:Sigma 54 modulation protein / ribosomal protein [Solirubrobacteraceae bacterium]
MSPRTESKPSRTTQVQVTAGEGVPDAQAEQARDRIASLQRYVDPPPVWIRLALRRAGHADARHRYLADAELHVAGRTFAAHTTGPTPLEATNEAGDELRRQLRDRVGKEVALRNEPARTKS